jgi:hypothetical protein
MRSFNISVEDITYHPRLKMFGGTILRAKILQIHDHTAALDHRHCQTETLFSFPVS